MKKKQDEWLSQATPKAVTDAAEVERRVRAAAAALEAAGAVADDSTEADDSPFAVLQRRAKPAAKR